MTRRPDPQGYGALVAFRARLLHQCARQGVTQDALADAAGCSKAYMSMLTRGEREPSLRLALAIARKLGVSLADMITEPQCAACADLPPAGFACLTCGTKGTTSG